MDSGRAYSVTEASDERLAVYARRGDAAAFAALVQRYEAPLFRYVRRMLGNAADAEDVFQETFLRVHQHLDRYRADAPFRPWLYSIATNLCRDRLRSRRRHPMVALESPLSGNPDGPRWSERLASGAPSPDSAACADETAERLQAALSKLPVKQRAVFLMARYEGLLYEEIAKSLRIPVGTVKSRMNKAVKFLMTELRDA